MIASQIKNSEEYFCHKCKNYTNLSQVEWPYACKLMVQELLAMGIALKIKTEDSFK